MDAEIHPEPTPEEREAILAAFGRDEDEDVRGLWWRAGVEESLDAEVGDEPRR